MQILWILNKELDISTSQSSRLAMAETLQSFGHQVVLVARYRHRKQAMGSAVPIDYLPSLNLPGLRTMSFLLGLWFWLPVLLLQARPDAILIDRPTVVWALVPWLPLSRLLSAKVRWVLDVRSPPTEREGISGRLFRVIYRGGLWLAGRLMHGWTTITPALREEIIHLGKIPVERIEIWSSGVDPAQFSPESRHRPEDWELDGQFVVVYHGLLSDDRALSETIEALALIQDRAPDLHLFLLGNGPDREQLARQVEELGLASRVVFHEPVPHARVPDYLAPATVGLVPAPNTPWYRVSSPLKLMEYLAMGKPVIATDMDANRAVLGEQGDAIYVPCDVEGRPSPESLAQAMLEARARFARFPYSAQNRRIVVEKYSWTMLARRVESYLLSLE